MMDLFLTLFLACFGYDSSCPRFDYDNDGVVGLYDYAVIQNRMPCSLFDEKCLPDQFSDLCEVCWESESGEWPLWWPEEVALDEMPPQLLGNGD